jgi:hypothetical protein
MGEQESRRCSTCRKAVATRRVPFRHIVIEVCEPCAMTEVARSELPQLYLWRGFLVFASIAAIGAAAMLPYALQDPNFDALFALLSVIASPLYFWFLMRSVRRAHAERRDALIAAGVKPWREQPGTSLTKRPGTWFTDLRGGKGPR